jgi:D-alanyl-D-alanine dipeptidase
LKQLATYLLLLTVIFAACEQKPHKVRRKLGLRRVFVVKDSTDADSLRKARLASIDTSYIEYVFKAYDLVNIRDVDSTIKVRLQYADTTNFLKKNFYDGLRKAYFTCETAIRIASAQYYLKQVNKDLSLVIFDASRPQHVQQMMLDRLKLPPLTKFNYLSRPDQTSLHNYGCAVDCGIINVNTGEYLDMGTGYDAFEKLSQPVYEYYYLKTGDLSREAYDNRRLLRYIMRRSKMSGINTEWWHFSAFSKEEAFARFPLIK